VTRASSSARRSFELVIFDCDGVLVDSEPLVNRIEAERVSQLGWLLSPEQARARFKGRTVHGVLTEIGSQVPTPDADWIYDWGMATALGFVRELRPIDGVEAVVRALHEASRPKAVASQSPPARVELSLKITGLDGFFGHHVYTASMVARPKPAPDLFLHVARALETSPSECVVIEDSPSGVTAAVAAGMTCWGFCATEPAEALRRAGANLVFDRMEVLHELLAL
jgi:beta-phosphoglucomutase-like phosphatase (HAD superfamily)